LNEQTEMPGMPNPKYAQGDLKEARTKVDDDMNSNKIDMIIWVNVQHSSLRQS